MQQLLRLLMSGYDEDLCPDGEIEGDVKDGKVRECTPKKRKSSSKRSTWKKLHVREKLSQLDSSRTENNL